MTIVFSKTKAIIFTGIMAVVFASGVNAQQQVDQIVNEGVARSTAAEKSQVKIDKIADQTDELLQQYKSQMKVVDGLKVYNTLLKRQVDGQMVEMSEIETSIEQVSVIERQITPLMLRMLEGLEQFVAADVPFLLEERQERIAKLKSIMEKPSISSAEKFRAVVEAFQIESEFGRTIEAYKDSLELDGKTLVVDVLRVGRVSLLYQSVDGEQNGVWDQDKRSWVTLASAEFKNPIAQGLKIARKQAPPDLLMMPIQAPEAAQ